jgi:hypothetical protein
MTKRRKVIQEKNKSQQKRSHKVVTKMVTFRELQLSGKYKEDNRYSKSDNIRKCQQKISIQK